MTIGEQVLNVLKSRTTEVQDVVDKMRELEDRKKNDHLDQKYIRDVLDPKLTELRVKRGNIKNLTEAEIRKMTEAYYYVISFEAPAEAPAEIEARVRIMEQVLRFLITTQEA